MKTKYFNPLNKIRIHESILKCIHTYVHIKERGNGKLFFTTECQLINVEVIIYTIIIDSSMIHQWMLKLVGECLMGNNIFK